MKIGLQIIRFNWPGSPDNIGKKLAEIGKTADEAGFDSIWAMDHFFQIDMAQFGLSPKDPMLDGYTVLGYMAAVTKRARLGTMVTGVVYRHPRPPDENSLKSGRTVRRARLPGHWRCMVLTRGDWAGPSFSTSERTH
jgi:hypothetical protein